MIILYACIFALSCIWMIWGTIFYMNSSDRIIRLPQKIIMVLISGPIIWLYVCLFQHFFRFMDWVAETMFKWLYKE